MTPEAAFEQKQNKTNKYNNKSKQKTPKTHTQKMGKNPANLKQQKSNPKTNR